MPSSSLPHARKTAYETAIRLGFERAAAGVEEPSRLQSLGIIRSGDALFEFSLLNQLIRIDLSRSTVSTATGETVRDAWAIIALHYLAAPEVPPQTDLRSFADFPDAEIYAEVFGGRIISRFLHTTGRTAAGFIEAATAIGGQQLAAEPLRFEFTVLPRIKLRISRDDGDEELPPGASVLYTADVQELLVTEDRVVVAELLLDSLAGRPLTKA